MKIRDIVIQPVYASALFSLAHFQNPESHSHFSLVNVITVTFNVAVTVEIVVPASPHVECTLNRPGRAALGAIELEIPAATAVVTGINSEVTSKVDMEGSVCVRLHEFTVLSNTHTQEKIILTDKNKSYEVKGQNVYNKIICN